MNRYELVYADTGIYPYPPGITTGNFEPWDVGDIDRDSLIDLIGPNFERANDSTFNVVTTQESRNYTYYPSIISWWNRYSYNEIQSAPFYLPPNLDNDNWRELLFLAEGVGITHIFENTSNNQNILVWSRYQVGAWSFAFNDFDLDNNKEFATANLGSLGRVSVYENHGDNQYERTFQDTIQIPNGSDVFSGNDIDGDGNPEFFVGFARIVGGNVWDFFLYMWEATANNTYQRTLIDQIRSVYWDQKRSKCGDIDGDGVEELIWSIGSRVMIYKATGNNQFQRIWEWTNDHGGQYPMSVVNIYDMNKNGYNELIISGYGKTSIFEVEAVRLLRPNGGEIIHPDSQELITWQTFNPPRCDSVSLFYSINNGQTYQSITTGLSGNDTSYLCTVPNVNSDSCKIKIIAYGPGWQYDESDGIFKITSLGVSEIASLSLAMTLGIKVYPNPAKSAARVSYSIPSPSPDLSRQGRGNNVGVSTVKGEGLSEVSLRLFDISGRLVKTLVNEYKKPGTYSFTLNTQTLASGVYFICLETNNKRIFERLLVIK